jgi:RimJ/RimL family protein N-acetyltransferase
MDILMRPLEEADLPTLIHWTRSAEFLLQWAGPAFAYPLTTEQLLEHHRGCTADPPTREMWKAVAQGQMVGHAELGSIDRQARTATISRVIVGEPKDRGRGIGAAMMDHLVRRAFAALDLVSVDLHVFDFNRRAVACYHRVGFRIESHLENVHRVGAEFWGLYRMSLDRPTPGQPTSLTPIPNVSA